MDKKTETLKDFFSRSVLAEKLGMSLKELTQLMIDSGWIFQEGKAWKLTNKGEFEGGVYRDSKKFGQYIVWPESILEHSAIREVNESVVSASALTKSIEVSARLFNRLVADLGWILPFAKGWKVTQLGAEQGGVQMQNEETGVPYVMWPRNLLSNPSLRYSLAFCSGNSGVKTLNGLVTLSEEHAQIGTWLYLSGLIYSYQRKLFFKDKQTIESDFYLPSFQVCIDFWPESQDPETLTLQLAKREFYYVNGIKFIELDYKQLKDIDIELSRLLTQQGVTI